MTVAFRIWHKCGSLYNWRRYIFIFTLVWSCSDYQWYYHAISMWSFETPLHSIIHLACQPPKCLPLLPACGRLINFVLESTVWEQWYFPEPVLLLVVLSHLLSWLNSRGKRRDIDHISIYKVLCFGSSERYAHSSWCNYYKWCESIDNRIKYILKHLQIKKGTSTPLMPFPK